MPRRSKKPARVQTPPRSPLAGFPDSPPLSPLAKEAIFNRNGSATYGPGGKSSINFAVYDLASEGIKAEWNCDELRSMVRKLLKSGEIKVVRLHRALHTSPKYYYPFMKQKGTHAGLGNIMYKKLHRFFLDREQAGKWVPDPGDIDSDQDECHDDTDNAHDGRDVEVISINSDGNDEPESDKENRPERTDDTTKYNCHQIRCKITNFIGDEGMKIDDFIRRLDSGPHAGVRNATYKAAHKFFLDRDATEALQKPADSKGKARAAPLTYPGNKRSQTRTPKSQQKGAIASQQQKSTAGPTSPSDVSSLPILPGEEEGTVPIHASCSDVRLQIADHLRQPNVTMASFCRALSACQGSNPDRFHGKGHGGPVQTVQLQSFLRKPGHMAGNTSKVFYTAYVYFEKLRVKERQEKSEKRLEMESIWGDEGVDTTTVSGNVACVTSANSNGWAYDEYGQRRTIF